ncbi:MAG: DEAD/DEAH box helicase [Cardiobacteriaceae bacterium]|nr:DEAD/DEAH box helicase [Cardiobacteriaceae bacterium]
MHANDFAALGLPEALLATIAKTGYTTPTPIQAQAIPLALAGRDLLLSAQTGSGKTAAFVLPALAHLLQAPVKKKKPRVLILTPTRELAQQVNDSVRRYGAGLNWLFTVPLVGGSPYGAQIQALKKGVSIVIATPGRLLDHLRAGYLDLSDLQILVLDEADRMLDMGFSEDINAIIDATPENRQTIMSSATWDGAVGKIAAEFTQNPERVAIKVETAHIEEQVYFCDDQHHKNQILDRLVCDPEMGQVMIFTATKRMSEEVAGRLTENGHRTRFLHGDLPQHKRNRIVQDLRKGKCDILVATDVAARGIDIPAISHVINYDLPRQSEDYVHRIGRSGRAGRSGMAMNLVSLADRSQLSAISRYLQRTMPEVQLEGLAPTKTAKPRTKPAKKFRGKSSKHKEGFGKHGDKPRFAGKGKRDGFVPAKAKSGKAPRRSNAARD